MEQAGLIPWPLVWLLAGLVLLLVHLAARASIRRSRGQSAAVPNPLRAQYRFALLVLRNRYMVAGNRARAQGHLNQAMRLYRRALVLGDLALGPLHLKVAETLEEYAIVLRAAQRDAEAAALEARARAIRAAHPKRGPPY